MDKPALVGALKILADGAKDVIAALQPGQSLSQKIVDFENLIPDAMAELASISDIGAEIKSLQASDIVELSADLVADCGFSNPKAQAVAAAGLKVLGDVASSVLPDLLALIAAVKA